MTAIALAKTAALQSGTDNNTVTREERFNQLIAVYMDDLFRYGYWLSGSHAVADDLVQARAVSQWLRLPAPSSHNSRAQVTPSPQTESQSERQLE